MNLLSNETSPYLLQHAENPVHWLPWTEASFEKAKREDKPILLSIGYSTCHWCHIMAHESFENETVADYLNQNYISIKVDREERPDIDCYFMAAAQAFLGHGGWPLTVWMTPEKQVYYAGTYYPAFDGDRGGSKGFFSYLKELKKVYVDRKDEAIQASLQIEEILQSKMQIKENIDVNTVDMDKACSKTYQWFESMFDKKHGGFGYEPKFPRPVVLGFLMNMHLQKSNGQALLMMSKTLSAMQNSGMYDQLQGGFHRYAVTRDWNIPHFEKMLYDNAQLVSTYLKAHLITLNLDYKNCALETLDYLMDEMFDQQQYFYSASDADSEGEEGTYFVWDCVTFERVLPQGMASKAMDFFGLKPEGWFEGKNILYQNPESEVVFSTEDWNELKQRLLSQRQKRIPPHIDKKMVLAWNAMTVQAMLQAAVVFSKQKYVDAAHQVEAFIANSMHQEGLYYRSFKDKKNDTVGFLDDFSQTLKMYIYFYQFTGEKKHLDKAEAIFERTQDLFFDPTKGYYYLASKKLHETFPVQNIPTYDGAEPSGNSVIYECSVLLYRFTLKTVYLDAIKVFESAMTQHVFDSGHAMPKVLDVYLSKCNALSIKLVCKDRFNRSDVLLNKVKQDARLLDKVIYFEPNQDQSAQMLGDQTTVYICDHLGCKKPITDSVELDRMLESL